MPVLFKRHAISKTQNEIRLVHLLGGQPSDPVHCSLKVVSLDGNPDFEALSYTWGDPEIRNAISLDGEELSITKNLLSALKSLRFLTKTRKLWIDALCINQEDSSEKAWQVSFMGEIYKKCRIAILWLGEESEKSDRWCLAKNLDCWTFDDGRDPDDPKACREFQPDLIENLTSEDREGSQHGRHPDCHWHGLQPRMSTLNQIADMLGEDGHLFEIPALKTTNPSFEDLEPVFALGAFLNRLWWSRSWTVQEAALPSVSKFYCGSLMFSFDKLAFAAERLYHHSQTCCSQFFTQLAQQLDPDLSYGEATINIFFRFQRHFSTLELARSWSSLADVSLMDFLYSFHDRKAKDPRDKIFAFLGMLPSEVRFRPDYAVGLKQLYESLSFHLLAECPDKSLSVLWREVAPTNFTPSWVKDFDKEMTAFNRRVRSEHYDAGSDGPPRIKRQRHAEISVDGAKVDVVSALSSSFHAANTYSTDQFSTIRTWAHFLKRTCGLYAPYLTGGTLIEAFSKTLTGDVHTLDPNYSGFTEDEPGMFIKSLLHDEPEDELVKATLAQEFNVSAADRRLFITGNGHIGLGPAWMLPGDEVWVLFGGSVPFILRPSESLQPDGCSSKRANAHRCYIVIGDCYVHGIMFGEIFYQPLTGQTVLLK